MLAPHPLESRWVASSQGRPFRRPWQAVRQVLPGARLLSGLTSQSMNRRRHIGVTSSGVNGGVSKASSRASATAIPI